MKCTQEAKCAFIALNELVDAYENAVAAVSAKITDDQIEPAISGMLAADISELGPNCTALCAYMSEFAHQVSGCDVI